MEVKQIYELLNTVTKEDLGLETVVKEDLSDIIDIGEEILNTQNVDNYVKSLVDRIGKTVFVNRKYNGRGVSVLKDSWEYGSILMKISADIPEAKENESWELTDGEEYNPNIFYKPSVSVKFFNSKTTFEIPMSFTERQIKESFNSATELNAFMSMIYDSIDKSMTLKIDSLIMRTINNMIAQVYNADTNGTKAINLLTAYNNAFSKSLTADKAVNDADFLRYASKEIGLYIDRISVLSTLFNVGGKARFTNKENLSLVMLSDFVNSSKVYLESDTFHNELLRLPRAETVAYWQGSGSNFAFDDVSKINVTIKDGNSTKDVALSGILAVMFDKDSIGVCNEDRRVTTNYNPKAEFFNNWYKFDCSFYNDLNENFLVFYVADSATLNKNSQKDK